MCFILKRMNLYLAYISKYNLNAYKQIILFMIPNEEEWHYLAAKKLSASFKRNNMLEIVIAWMVFIPLEQKTNLICRGNYVKQKMYLYLQKKLCETEDVYGVAMHSKDTAILEFTQYQKSDKISFIIYTRSYVFD